MGDTTTEYIHLVINTIIFCSAVGMLLVFLNILGKYNRGELESQRTKASVTMDTEIGYSSDHIYVKGSEVFTDIIGQDANLPIYLDGTLLATSYLQNIREENTTYVSDLRNRIAFDADYLIRHQYYSTNELMAVYYERQ